MIRVVLADDHALTVRDAEGRIAEHQHDRLLRLELDGVGDDPEAPPARRQVRLGGTVDGVLSELYRCDEEAAVANLRKFKRRVPRTKVLEISAVLEEGIPQLKAAMRKAVEAHGTVS